MPYGEMKFDDEDYFDNQPCEFCGERGFHDPDCIYSERFSDSEVNEEEEQI
jgi:hypothetical protein